MGRFGAIRVARLLRVGDDMAKTRRMDTGAQSRGATTAAAGPDRNSVAMRAYELYLARGGGDGKAMDDWLLAERELQGRNNRTRRTRSDES